MWSFFPWRKFNGGNEAAYINKGIGWISGKKVCSLEHRKATGRDCWSVKGEMNWQSSGILQ